MTHSLDLSGQRPSLQAAIGKENSKSLLLHWSHPSEMGGLRRPLPETGITNRPCTAPSVANQGLALSTALQAASGSRWEVVRGLTPICHRGCRACLGSSQVASLQPSQSGPSGIPSSAGAAPLLTLPSSLQRRCRGNFSGAQELDLAGGATDT